MDSGISRARILEMHGAGDRSGALPLYLAWLAARPDDARMWSGLGALLRAEGRLDQALRAQRRAQALAPPDDPTVLNNLANILADLGHNAEAVALRRRLLAQRPDPTTEAMIGKALRADGRIDEAVEWLRAAHARHPAHVEIRLQLALTLLTRRDYVEGFAHYAVRWQTDELTPRTTTMPKWDGAPLEGRRVLVMPEQGFGDTVAFARFLPLLRRRGAGRVILSAKAPVLRLLQQVEGADAVIGPGTTPEADLCCDMMDLPALAFAEAGQVPPPTRLALPKDSRDRARAATRAAGDRLRVGVVWTGSPSYRANAARSFSHENFLPLTGIEGVQLYSLDKGPALAAFRADGSAAFIRDVGSSDRDFADCAAMMERMDLIITSDTATAHIAGSLGHPVWTLLHRDAFWLWGRGSESTPSYPSMRLIRQHRPHDWSAVFDTVGRDLAVLAAKRRVA